MFSLKGREGTYEGILAPGNAPPPGYFLIALAIVKAPAASVEMLRAVVLDISGVLSRTRDGMSSYWAARLADVKARRA